MAVAERTERHGAVERLHVARAVAGRPLYWTSVYRAGTVLIDTGCASCRSAVARFVARGPVTDVLTTHHHEDHVGNHELLMQPRQGGQGHQAPLPIVYAPRRAVDLLDRTPPRLPFYRWITWGAHGPAPGARPVPEAFAAGGRRFRAIATPGHSTDHVAYLDEEASAVFAGDAWFGRLRAARAEEDVPAQMRSLRALAALDPAVLYPTHGPIVERPRARLLDVADHFDRLGEKARALAERGLAPRRIRRELLGAEPALTWWSQGAFSAENLVKSLLRED